MRIAPINTGLPLKYYHNNKITETGEADQSNIQLQQMSSPNFCSFSILAVMKAAAIREGIKGGFGIFKAKKILNYKEYMLDCFSKPENFMEALPGLIGDLSKVSDDIDQYSMYNEYLFFLLQEDCAPLWKIKRMCLEKVFPILNDNNTSHQEAKKALLSGMFESQDHISGEFRNAFKALPDNIYKNFKQTIVERALFAEDILKKCINKPYLIASHLDLASSLSPEVYKDSIDKIYAGVIKNFNKLAEITQKSYKNIKGKAFSNYTKGFAFSDVGEKYESRIFYNLLEKADYDKKKVSEILNISEEQADSILQDVFALVKSGKAKTSEEAEKILQDRINKKFYTNEVYNNSASMKKDDIDNFINKTGQYKEKFKQEFKKMFEELKEQVYKESQSLCDSEEESSHDKFINDVYHVICEM